MPALIVTQRFALVGIAVLACLLPKMGWTQESERLSASIVLEPALIEGPYHTVAPIVVNDGSMNRYRISSEFGPLEARSTAELEQFIRELAAIDKLAQLSDERVFAEQLGTSLSDTVTGAVSLLTDTQATLVSAAAGVEKIAQRINDRIVNGSSEQGTSENPLGPAATKRAYAGALGVDPYSRNPILQAHLDRVAKAGYAGGIVASTAMALVGGPIVSAGSTTSSLQGVDVSLSPADARRQNRRLLSSMGIGVGTTNAFLNHPALTPTQQSLVVHSLRSLRGTRNREQLLAQTSTVTGREQGAYYERRAGLYSRYHRVVTPLSRFVPLGTNTGAVTRDNGLVMMLPTDHLRWTSRNARLVEQLENGSRHYARSRTRELWLSGTVTLRMARELKSRGWQPVPHATRRLSAAR
jgi:hypothetical protein